MTPWVWLWREQCQHHAPLACAVPVILWGPDASSDKLRAGARCASCGGKGATLQRPGRARKGNRPTTERLALQVIYSNDFIMLRMYCFPDFRSGSVREARWCVLPRAAGAGCRPTQIWHGQAPQGQRLLLPHIRIEVTREAGRSSTG
jgi:hypothetical protein